MKEVGRAAVCPYPHRPDEEPHLPRHNLQDCGVVLVAFANPHAVLLPSEPEIYGTENNLVSDIQQFIHRHVDLSATFEKLRRIT